MYIVMSTKLTCTYASNITNNLVKENSRKFSNSLHGCETKSLVNVQLNILSICCSALLMVSPCWPLQKP